MTINQTKNSAMDSTHENFSTVHGLMCRSCSLARRGPRARAARAARLPLAAAPGVPPAPGAPWTSGTAAVGASGVPIGGDVQVGPAGVPGAVEVEPQGVEDVGVDGDGPPPEG